MSRCVSSCRVRAVALRPRGASQVHENANVVGSIRGFCDDALSEGPRRGFSHFKTAAFDHSATPPSNYFHRRLFFFRLRALGPNGGPLDPLLTISSPCRQVVEEALATGKPFGTRSSGPRNLSVSDATATSAVRPQLCDILNGCFGRFPRAPFWLGHLR